MKPPQLRATFWALALIPVLVSGCSGKDDPTDAAPEEMDAPIEAPVEDTGAIAEEEAPEDEFPYEATPPRREVRGGAGGATVHRDAAVIVAGEMKLEVRPNSLKAPMVVQISTQTPESLNLELPPGLLVGAGSGTPRDAGFLPVARWHIPLLYEMEPGTVLEVLSWHPQLLTWLNLGDAAVTSSGTHALFFTMVMGDVVLRKKPVRDPENDALCPGPNFKLREEWPGREEMTVGLTPEPERIARDHAFRYLADFRLSDAAHRINFKNEEVMGAWHRNAVPGQSYADEDFLMDPNGAAALTLLEHYVGHEWVDPFTGESAVQVRLTEAYDSMIEHSKPSTHYQGRGLDLTLSPVPPPGAASRRAYYGRLARLSVCSGFDYVLFEDNFHVHASVHPAKVAVLVQGEDGQYGVLRGDLWAPERWELLPYRWDKTKLEARELAWTGWSTIEIRGGADEAALMIHADDGTARRDVATAFTPIRRMQIGTQELRVAADQLYLVNTHGRAPVGSGQSEEDVVRVPTPVQFPLQDWTVIDAAFRPHDKTRKAWKEVGEELGARARVEEAMAAQRAEEDAP